MTDARKGAEAEIQGEDDCNQHLNSDFLSANYSQLEDWRMVNSIGKNNNVEKLGFGDLTLHDRETKLSLENTASPIADSKDFSTMAKVQQTESYAEVNGESLINHISFSLVDGKDVASQRNRLVDNLEKSFDDTPGERDRAKIFMGNFEERMISMEQTYQKQGLDREQAHRKVQEEVRETYRQVNRILDKNEPSFAGISDKERAMLAKQILANACNTNDIGQGGHNTCNVAAIEVRTYCQDPAAATKLVADVALTGKYTTRDGHEIAIDKGSLVPHDEAKNDPPLQGGRGFASQVFQVAAVNIYHQRHGSWRYEQREPSGKDDETGERLVDYSVNPPKDGPTFYDKFMGKDSEVFYDNPNLGGPQIIDICNQISDNKDQNWYFAQKDNAVGDVPRINSEDDLLKQLVNAERTGQLPIVLRVNTNNEPFYTDSGAGKAGGSGGWHVVTVMNFTNGDPAKIMVDNQWDRNKDHTAKSNAIPLSALYRAMQQPQKNS